MNLNQINHISSYDIVIGIVHYIAKYFRTFLNKTILSY